MVNIAIVEDDSTQAEQLSQALLRYSQEFSVPLKSTIYTNAMAFLGSYSGNFDMVFMDIMMPLINGMDASRLLREKDDSVMLIFVTSMQQYAIEGYAVGAFDFILKPVNYPEFKLKMTRAMNALLPKKKAVTVLIKTDTGFVRLTPPQILYIEVQQHHCIYHTAQGDYRQYQSMKSAETLLEDSGFARCNNYLLVNLAHVSRVDGMTVYVGNTPLPISYPRKKAFSEKMAAYLGENE